MNGYYPLPLWINYDPRLSAVSFPGGTADKKALRSFEHLCRDRPARLYADAADFLCNFDDFRAGRPLPKRCSVPGRLWDSVFHLLLGLPFLAVYFLLALRRQAPDIPLNAPKNKWRAILLALIGLLVCMAGNYATNGLILFFNLFGIELSAPEVQAPASVWGCVLLFVQSAVVPAVVEEFAMRGVVMQPLRKYGDWFAILTSAFVFALMHGNLVQAPFAFIAGIGLGYAVIASGSLWTGILIHLLNNSISVIQTIAIAYLPEGKAAIVSAILIGVVIAAGAAALLVYLVKKEMRFVLSSFQRAAAPR